MSLPVEPLEAWFALNCPPTDIHQDIAEERMGRVSANRLADSLGVHRHTLARWRVHGIPLHSADAAAITLGLHPAELWDEWWTASEPARGRPRRQRLPGWWPDVKAAAIEQSWRLRAECPTGRAATLARTMFNMPDPQETTAA